MEYKSEEENGDSAWYKLVGDRNIPVKVSTQRHGIGCRLICRNFKMAVRFYNELNTKYCRFLHKINHELRLENIMK